MIGDIAASEVGLSGASNEAVLIGASGGFDHYPTGRDLVILGLPLAVKLRERR